MSRATLNADGSITLSWTPDDASVTGYEILRRRPQAGEDALTVYVSDTGSTATTYTDTGTGLGRASAHWTTARLVR